MTLRAQLAGAVGPVTASLIGEIGVRCDIRRRDSSTRDALGQESTTWYRPSSALLGAVVYLYQQDEQARARMWGREIVINADGLATRQPLRETDRIRPRDGEYAGRVFEIVRRRPDDIANIAQLGLLEIVPNGTDRCGF